MRIVTYEKGRAWVEIDMESMRHNVKVLRNILPDRCKLMPAVKANAYGHGAIEISRELNKMGVYSFCVASVSEAVELRKAMIEGEILILGYTHPDDFCLLRRFRLMQTVVDFEYAKLLNGYGKKIAVHIKVDTGMNRLGESFENTANIFRIFDCENLEIEGIYSHFASSNSSSTAEKLFTQAQIDRFEEVLKSIRDQGYPLPKSHIQNSYGVFCCPDLSYDYARVGIALYGAYKAPELLSGLRSVLSLRARVSAVKTVSKGETVGYHPTCAAPRDMKIALLSIGYADGIPRTLSNGVGRVLIRGKSAPVVGLVCMDQVIVDVTDIKDVKQGDVATIIGRDGTEEISVLEIADTAGTIPNEILSRLGDRLERIYE